MKSTFGSRVKQSRLAAGLTLAKLADSCGVSRGAICQWENDRIKQSPRSDHLFKTADAMGVSARWLLYGDQSANG